MSPTPKTTIASSATTAETAFSQAVPWLLLVATMLLIWGESLQALLYRHFGHRQSFSTASQFLLTLFFIAICAYGGFFNAGFGIILLGYLTLAGHNDIHLMNGLKLLVSAVVALLAIMVFGCLLYTSPSPRDQRGSRMPSSA